MFHVQIDIRNSSSVCQPSDFTVEPSKLHSMALPINQDLIVNGTLVLKASSLQRSFPQGILTLWTLKKSSFCPAQKKHYSVHSVKIFFRREGKHSHYRSINLKNARRNNDSSHFDNLFNRWINWNAKTVKQKQKYEVEETTFLPGCVCCFLRRVASSGSQKRAQNPIWPRRDLNTQPSDLESDALPLLRESER